MIDPLLAALIAKLPQQDEPFSHTEREAWLAAADAIFTLIYPPAWTQEARERQRSSAGVFTIPRVLIEERDGSLTDLLPDCEVFLDTPPLLQPSEAPCSTTSADAVDGASGGEAADASGAGPAPVTSSPTSIPGPTTPSSDGTAPGKYAVGVDPAGEGGIVVVTSEPVGERVKPGELTAKAGRQKYTHDQKAHAVKEAVRIGSKEASMALGIHVSIIRRWMGEMPQTVKAARELHDRAATLAAQPGGEPIDNDAALLADLEAERDRPIPEPPKVQWPTQPFERRPVDAEQVRRAQADAG